LRIGYSRATHRNKMEGASDPDCPFCTPKLTLEHILWQSKETEEDKRKKNMTKEGTKMLVEYVKYIGLYYGL
jgi:hypothetical protein